MGDHNRRLSWESQVKFKDQAQVILSEWSYLRNIIQSLWHRKCQQLQAHVLSFFTETADPDMDGIATMLKKAAFKWLNCDVFLMNPSQYKARGPSILNDEMDPGLGFSPKPRTQPVEDLWALYQACLVEHVDPDDETKKLKLSVDKFEHALQLFLSEWSDLKINRPAYIASQIDQINDHVFDLFSATAEPDVDSMALILRQAIYINLETMGELSTCNQVAQQLLSMHQSLLDGNY